VGPTTPAVTPAGWSVGRWPWSWTSWLVRPACGWWPSTTMTRRPADRRDQAADYMPLEMAGQRPPDQPASRQPGRAFLGDVLQVFRPEALVGFAHPGGLVDHAREPGQRGKR
jgi:hypothetical protein